MNPRSWNGSHGVGIAVAIAVALVMLIPGIAQALPADRAYEMVSPPDKEGGDVGAGLAVGNHRASADGDHLAYLTVGGWGDAQQNGIAGLQVAHRQPDIWESHFGLMPVFPIPSLGDQLGIPAAISHDFSRLVVNSNMDPETGEELPHRRLFIFDPVTKDAEQITPDPVDGAQLPVPVGGDVYGNADFSRVVFRSLPNFTADTPPEASNIYKVYFYEDGELELASRLPDDSPAWPASLPQASSTPEPTARKAGNVISRSGDAFYFESGGALYRRDLSEEVDVTELVNVDENSLGDPGGGTNGFGGGSEDGRIAFFYSTEQLVDEDTDDLFDIYRYEQDKPEGSRLTLVSVDAEPADSASNTGPVLDVDDEGGSVYFTSASQLVDGETTAPGTKLYHFDGQGLHFIAITDPLAPPDAMVSANGDYFGFVSAATGITAEDNGGFDQAYIYDAETGAISCASCLSGGATSTGAATWRPALPMLGLWLTAIPEPINNISNNGHVFFETEEPLTAGDTNNKSDVYVWQDGNLDLISTGTSTDRSHLMDANVDGSTVFFQTRSQLVGWDTDNSFDAYAARIGGGLPEPPPPPTPCIGDGCQGSPSTSPQAADPGSGSFSGAGNPRGARDCDSAQRKVSTSKRKAKSTQQKAKQLKRKARNASGKKAKRLKKKAKKAGKAAKKAKSKRRQAQRVLRDCRSAS